MSASPCIVGEMGSVKRLTATAFAALCALSCNGTTGILLEEPAPDDGAGGVGGSSERGEPNQTGDGDSDDLLAPNPFAHLAPEPGASFQIQLLGTLDTSIDADVFIVDFEKEETELAPLVSASKYIACYFSAGSFEPWRDDAELFPESVLGDPLDDYPNERWIDVSSDAVLERMSARITLAKERGCSAIYPSLVRPGSSEVGFGLSSEEYLLFSQRLVALAHEAELGAIHPSGSARTGEEELYDATLVLVSGCVSADNCGDWASYQESGRAVFIISEGSEASAADACPPEMDRIAPTIVKEGNLSAFRYECP